MSTLPLPLKRAFAVQMCSYFAWFACRFKQYTAMSCTVERLRWRWSDSDGDENGGGHCKGDGDGGGDGVCV